MERMIGVEPTFTRWQRVVLPLDDIRVGAGDPSRTGNYGLEDRRDAISPRQHENFFVTFQLSKNWHGWPESNRQDAVLETAPAPLPHPCATRDRSGVAGGLCLPFGRGHNPVVASFTIGHTASVELLAPAPGLEPRRARLQCEGAASRAQRAHGAGGGTRTLVTAIPTQQSGH